MRSISEILNLVVDGKISTQEEASALMAEEAADYAEALKISKEEAQEQIMRNIRHCSAYYSHDFACRVLDLFQIIPGLLQ